MEVTIIELLIICFAGMNLGMMLAALIWVSTNGKKY